MTGKLQSKSPSESKSMQAGEELPEEEEKGVRPNSNQEIIGKASSSAADVSWGNKHKAISTLTLFIALSCNKLILERDINLFELCDPKKCAWRIFRRIC